MVLSTRRVAVLVLILLASASAFAQPTARSGARMAYHEEIGKIILFGGATPFAVEGSTRVRFALGDTWEWSGRRWVRLSPANSPPARWDLSMVYEASRTRILIFGGTPNGTDVLGDTWVFDNGNWTQLETPSSPPARRLGGITYDPIRDRVILFGGTTAAGALYDTWEFDGTTWTRANENGPKITAPSLVYDQAYNQTLMLGVNESGASEMYRWTDSTWEKLSPATMPACVAQGALVFHNLSGRVIQVGGLCSSGFSSDETWQWDGTTWGKVDVVSTAGAFFGAAYAYDPVRQEILLFGGDSFGERNTTFRFIPDRWTFVGNDFTPGPRSLMMYETDPVRNVIWLFGGQNESSRFQDLWSYSFGRWERNTTGGANAPTFCDYPVGAFDTERGRMVLLCEDSSTFEWDGQAWYKFPDLRDKPPARRFSSMVYDERNKRVVLFGGFDGGQYLKETWLWNGQTWTEVDKTGPASRSLAALFYDRTQQRVMLYGGIGRTSSESAIVRFKDMWNFDGTTWTEMKSTTTPPPRYGVYVEFDPQTNRIVMFGGKDEKEKYLNEHWEWNGSAWQQVDSANRPSPRMNGGMAFDPTRQELTIFGGYAGAYFSEVWSLEENRWDFRPDMTGGRRRPTLSSGAVSGEGVSSPEFD